VLRLSTGDRVSLDRGVLLGRSPRVAEDLSPQERPHQVRLPSPENDISRNHVEVVLDGWQVLVRDLGSTNGTLVTLPGMQPVQLSPHDLHVIEPGTVVTLSPEVFFVFEAGT
jgi:pSer/pThr/pTyr-binding forkhead associated (FHA) protein